VCSSIVALRRALRSFDRALSIIYRALSTWYRALSTMCKGSFPIVLGSFHKYDVYTSIVALRRALFRRERERER